MQLRCASAVGVTVYKGSRLVTGGPGRSMATRGRKRDQTDESADASEGRMLDRGVMKNFKICVQCRRPMVQRAVWKDPATWAAVKYCSDGCRKAAKSKKKPDGETAGDQTPQQSQ